MQTNKAHARVNGSDGTDKRSRLILPEGETSLQLLRLLPETSDLFSEDVVSSTRFGIEFDDAFATFQSISVAGSQLRVPTWQWLKPIEFDILARTNLLGALAIK
jgi:hypothetical protein